LWLIILLCCGFIAYMPRRKVLNNHLEYVPKKGAGETVKWYLFYGLFKRSVYKPDLSKGKFPMWMNVFGTSELALIYYRP